MKIWPSWDQSIIAPIPESVLVNNKAAYKIGKKYSSNCFLLKFNENKSMVTFFINSPFRLKFLTNDLWFDNSNNFYLVFMRVLPHTDSIKTVMNTERESGAS